jgi:hypothetical protein
MVVALLSAYAKPISKRSVRRLGRSPRSGSLQLDIASKNIALNAMVDNIFDQEAQSRQLIQEATCLVIGSDCGDSGGKQ